MQSFAFKTAKLTKRVTVEVDKRWVRSKAGGRQLHIDFNLVDTIHYWVTESRGAALTGHLVITDRQGRKLALQCSGFGVDRDMAEFLRAASATLAAIGEVRPDLRVMPEATALHRALMAGVIVVAFVVIGGAMSALDVARDMITRVAGLVVGAVLVAGYLMLRFGPLRKKPKPLAPADLARQIGVQVL